MYSVQSDNMRDTLPNLGIQRTLRLPVLLFSKAIWQSRVASSRVTAFALPTDGINYSSYLTLPNSSSMG
jgi:hypothetical protein